LTAKTAVLRDEARHVADRRSHLNDALAWSAARWAADQALAAGASVVYVEDLRSMEARGMAAPSTPACLRLSGARSPSGCGTSPPSTASPSSPSPHGAPRRTAPAASHRYATARHQTSPLSLAGSGRAARDAAGRATATTAPGSGSPPAASPTRTRPPPSATTAPWPSAPSTKSSKPARSSSPMRPGETGPRPAPRPGEAPHAARPGDARHPPRHGRQAGAASVRRDTRHRPGNCPAQPAGTSARARPARNPPDALTGHAGRHSAPGFTSAPTPPHPNGNHTPSTIPQTRDN
jgi:hypothetical protein